MVLAFAMQGWALRFMMAEWANGSWEKSNGIPLHRVHLLSKEPIERTIMNLKHYTFMGALSVLAAGGVLLAPGRARAIEAGVEELTRGPVHEAFAASVSFDPTPGILVRSTPPSMIEEVPPEQRLEGDNVAWIPGYWGWDEEQGDFLWISGIWRNLPPGRQWVPGYWGEAEAQWQWTSGYWADETTQEVAYLPQPPKSIESGPNVESPSRNHVWISGNWRYREDRYAWQPGYWEPAQTNWIWIPAHYQWTRRGYVFIDGYWDYNVSRRGVVFAPVRFSHDYYNRPDYSYTPSTVIVLNVFLNHLFVRPSYGHYYFGDYYAPRYRDEGFYAGYSYASGRRGYDPIYVHNRWEHRDDSNWERSRRDDFEYYRDHEDARPPRTWAALSALAVGSRKAQRDNFDFAQPLNTYAANRDNRQSFQAVGKKERDQIVGKRKEMIRFVQERQKLESRAMEKAPEGSDKPAAVVREKFTKSPVVAKRAEQLPSKEAPPKLPAPRKFEPRDPNGGADLPDGVVRPGDKGKPDKQVIPGREGKDRTPEPMPDKKDTPAVPDAKDKPRPDREPDVDKGRKPDEVPDRTKPEINKPDKKMTPPERQVEPKTPTKREIAPPERKPVTPPREVAPVPKREIAPPEKKPVTPPREVAPAPKREIAPPERKPVSPPREIQPPPKRESPPERKQVVPPRDVQPPRQIAPPVQPRSPVEPKQPRGKGKDELETEKDKSRN